MLSSITRSLCLLAPGLLGLGGAVHADEPAGFTPPQAYPLERYVAGWNKNPFTLKTSTPAVVQGSFAKDLAIGSHYGAADNPTVVVVNTKTSERTLLRKDKPAANGMCLKSLHLVVNRKECQVEVALGAEAAVISYDANYLGQLAANESSRAAATPASSPAARGAKMPAPAIKLPPLPTVKVSQMAAPVPFTPAAR